MEAMIERDTGAFVGRKASETPGKIGAWNETWQVLRPKLTQTVDRHPSPKVRQLGNDLAEDMNKLLLDLDWLASTYTGTDQTAAASKAAGYRHEHAATLADDLLRAVHG